jgi:hypothetical protein
MITGCSSLKPDRIVKNNRADNTDSNGSNTQKTLTNLIPIAIPAAIITGGIIVYYAYKAFCKRTIKGVDKTNTVPSMTEGKNQKLEVTKKPEEKEVQEHPPVQQLLKEEKAEDEPPAQEPPATQQPLAEWNPPPHLPPRQKPVATNPTFIYTSYCCYLAPHKVKGGAF